MPSNELTKYKRGNREIRKVRKLLGEQRSARLSKYYHRQLFSKLRTYSRLGLILLAPVFSRIIRNPYVTLSMRILQSGMRLLEYTRAPGGERWARSVVMGTLWGLVEVVFAGIAGAWMYREPVPNP